MIMLVVEGESDKVFFEYVRDSVLQQTKFEVTYARGIDRMLQRELPDAIRLLQQGLYTKVIAVFDTDEMSKPYDSKKTRFERLRELLKSPNLPIGGFAVRNNLEDLIKDYLPTELRQEFKERLKRQGKPTAIKWAIKQNLDQNNLRARLADLQRSLNCNLIKNF